jgi:hypothetical protein
MSETVKLQFYRINRFGYYPYGSNEATFGSTAEILNDLYAWVHGEADKQLSETSTFELEGSEDINKAYCFELVKSRLGDFVLVVWNETPSNEGRVVSVSGSDTVGSANVEFTDLPEGAIPGYATYFWFIPEYDVFASIRFHHSLMIGKGTLDKYLKEFTAKFTSFVVMEETEDGAEILGYSNGENQEPQHLLADFKSFLYRKPGQIEYIKQNIDSIRKVIRKNKLNPLIEIHRTAWQKFLELVNVSPGNQNRLIEEVDIKYEMPFVPSQEELENMIDGWEEEHDTKWDDIGFQFTGEQGVKWLSSSVAKSQIEVEVTRDNEEIVDATSLLRALTEQREVALRLIDS